MRIFVAGASGVIGVRLVPLLVGGHVAGMTRSPDKTGRLHELGAQPVVCDVFAAAARQTLPALAAPPGVTLVADDRAGPAGPSG